VLIWGRPEYWETLSSVNPPLFESEAAYLKRLGLLLPGEARRLGKMDYEPECICAGDPFVYLCRR
jgi:hypothetical protein